MNKFQVIFALAMIAIASAEPPVLSGGYGYKRPSYHIGSGIGSGLLFGGGGHSNFLSGGSSHSSSFQTNEGQYVDPQLLHKVKEILLEHENLEQSHRNQHHSSGFISDTYGPPSSHYGVPYYNERVVGIDLGHINQAIQVAHFHQQEHQYHSTPSISYGLPSAHIPSGSYGVPHIPSGSYGTPSQTIVVPPIHVPSDSYGAPHH